ncbi:helix-turn-helix domain-containing protein [Paenibacillus sp. FSL H3-0333]|uniref:helix-turn-helix domain-containing protein n=1 Tax=Paenibacillus sp. FSL H3-0333 TaxID=2921373 RepID=UPI0030F80A3E
MFKEGNEKDFILYCKLGELLEKYNISTNKLSDDIGHRRSTIIDLLHNKDMENKRIPASLIVKLCKYFDITPNDLFEIKQINHITNEPPNE